LNSDLKKTEGKAGLTPNKVNHRVEIPIYSRRVFNDPQKTEIIGKINVLSEEPENYWLIRNIFICCESLHFKTA
jgi:hypothetical protein